MTKLSVNINKIATLRNSRGGNNPDVIQLAKDCERFGAQGITVHPRPDERHITKKDVYDLRGIITTEFNIEGFPDDRYIKIIEDIRPTQATLVPDPPEALTSNAGWDIEKNQDFLKVVIAKLKSFGVRVSIFVDPTVESIRSAGEIKADRIELYTEPYARAYDREKYNIIDHYKEAASVAKELRLGINAGHDLNLINLKFLKASIPYLSEVSIGHALICDSLYYGLENTIQMYLRQLDLED
ncbi:MAG TPA: pyridoxine 5'-phosphate synthase [Cyclobacteriaceae bacterium]